MRKPGIDSFKYFVGVRSLAELATPEDRICVLNITGNESRAVTPVSHAYSGGNVVFGSDARTAAQLERVLEDAVAARLGVETAFFVRSAKEVRSGAVP